MNNLFNFRKLSFRNGPSVPDAGVLGQLEKAGVPLSFKDCNTCTDPCEDHDSYPARFDIDIKSELLGSVKPFRRQIIISTGKHDWPHDVTEVAGSLASHMLKMRESSQKNGPTTTAPSVPGVYESSNTSSSSNKVTILNGNHRTLEDDSQRETVLVFPDYKIVSGVTRDADGARQLWEGAVDPSLGRAGLDRPWPAGASSWVLPYGCVILLCSHKRRDNRCGIAAPLLEKEFIRSLSSQGWEPHTSLPNSVDELNDTYSLDNYSDNTSSDGEAGGSQSTGQVETDVRLDSMISKLKHVCADETTSKSALILRNSHVGGHKYAGNVIIYFPQGSGVWYGRVTPHDIDMVVEETIVGGRLLPQLMRGGVNLTHLAKCGKHTLADW